MLEQFHLAKLPEIFFGTGSIKKTIDLTEKYGNSVALFTGSSFFKRENNGNQLLKQIKSSGIQKTIFTISGEPTTGQIDEITNCILNNIPSCIIAIGGGSVIDAGKAVSAMARVKGKVWDYMEGNPDTKAHPGIKLPFIAVPTTAGTGSEATKNAVLTKTGKKKLKRSLRHDNFVPDIAIVDPALTLSCPNNVIAASGLDALTQTLEAYLSTKASPITDALAYSGLQRISSPINKIAHNKNIEIMTNMSYAALISGIVLANAGLGAVHGFAAVLGSYYDIPHGVICGNLIGAVNKANIEKLQKSDKHGIYAKKYAEAGKLFCDNKNKSESYYQKYLVDKLEELIYKLNIPGFGQYGLNKDKTAALAKETGIKNNPVNLSDKDLENILNSRI